MKRKQRINYLTPRVWDGGKCWRLFSLFWIDIFVLGTFTKESKIHLAIIISLWSVRFITRGNQTTIRDLGDEFRMMFCNILCNSTGKIIYKHARASLLNGSYQICYILYELESWMWIEKLPRMKTNMGQSSDGGDLLWHSLTGGEFWMHKCSHADTT